MTWVDPQMAAILAEMAAIPTVDLKTLPIAEARRRSDAASIPWSEGAPPLPTREMTIETGAGSMRARLYGGGWTFGSIDTHDGTMRDLAVASGSPVLGFDYRLAPEHPFPTPLDDTLAALAFVENGGLGAPVPAARLAVAGDSAGAHLALAALIARRDAGLPALAGATLFYGCYAPIFDTDSHAAFGDGAYLLTTVNMRWYWANFLGEQSPGHPLAMPLLADLAGLPPVYLAAAGLDPLRDDTLRLADRLAHAGVSFRLDHVPGIVHGSLRMSRRLDAGRRMSQNGGAFVRSCLG